MMETMGCSFFSYLEQTLHMWLLWPGLCLQIFQFSYSFTPCKGLELNSMKRKTEHWLPFSLYNPHVFLEILDQECAMFNFLEKKIKVHTEKLTCTLQLFPSF